MIRADDRATAELARARVLRDGGDMDTSEKVRDGRPAGDAALEDGLPVT